MTLDEYGFREGGVFPGKGGVVVTSFSDSADLANVALVLHTLTAGTLRVSGADGVQVDFLAADLTALGNRIPFAVKRIHQTGTTVTRCLVVV